MTIVPTLVSSSDTVITLNGSVIPSTISGLTAHRWVADSTGLYNATTNLAAEWQSDYKAMLAGNGNMLTPLQRMEGNAEAVIENTKAAKLPDAKLAALREDLQREFDAIDGAMKIDQAKYGIDPTQEFNTYTYLKMEETLQGNQELLELGIQGHGLNNPPSARYDGYTTDFQNKTDNTTYYVGGGSDNGEKAIAAFLDDVVLSHAPFPTVMHNGVMEQLNQNGNFEDSLATVVASANEDMYQRVFVASDFSTDKNATGADMEITGVKAAPPLPVAGAGQISTLDGSVISGTISTTLTAHKWVADSTGLFQTTTDLAAEWKADLALMNSGASLTPLQRWEANAEVVVENTGVDKLSAAKQQAFREDAQREFDAVWAAMKIDQAKLGISDTAQFTDHTYLMMEQTLQGNETLKQLAIEGHGLNGKVSSQYKGFTEGFQNNTDNKTLYIGPGIDSGEKAIADFFDDVIITHASFPTVWHNGHFEQLNQNGGKEDTLDNVVVAANQILFTTKLTAADFSKPAA